MLDDDLDDSLPPPPPPQPQPQPQQQPQKRQLPLLEHLPPPPPPPPPSAAQVEAALSALDATVAMLRALKAELVLKFEGSDLKSKQVRADKWLLFINMTPNEQRELQFKLDDEYMKEWVLTGHVHCAIGCGRYENGDGNFKRSHLTKPTHVSKVEANQKDAVRQMTLMEARRASAAAAEVRSADIRATLLLHGLPYATYSNVGKLYSDEALRMATFLSRKDGGGNPLKTGKQVDTASARAEELLFEETKEVLKGLSGALIIDEANIKFDMKQKVLGMVFEATVLEGPVLLELIFDVEDGWEDDPVDKDGNKWSDKAAAAVLNALKLYGKTIDEITTMVADNATAMAALARKLGLPLMNCIPHSLQVAYTAFTKHFKRYTIAIYNLAAFIKAGGGSARIKDLNSAGISARKLQAKATRWRQGHEVAKFLLNVEAGAADERIMFERVRSVIKSSINFKVGSEYKAAKKAQKEEAAASAAAAAASAAGGADADSDGHEEDEIGENEVLVICPVPGAVRSKAPVKKISIELQQVYETIKEDSEPRNFLGLLELYIVDYFASDLLELITAMSANVNTINLSGLTDRIAALRRRLDLGKTSALHNIPFQAIFAKAAFSCSVTEQTRYVDKFSPIIVAACTDALAKFDELVPKAMEQLVHRLRYEPTNQPKPFPAVPKRGLGHRYDADDVRSFFGAAPGDIDLEIISDWNIYVEKWPSIPDKIKNLGIGPFWEHAEVLELFPDKKAERLRRYAHWWGAQPTSSVAMERVYAIMRSMEGSQRMTLSREKVNLELKIKCNPWIAQRVWKRSVASLPLLK